MQLLSYEDVHFREGFDSNTRQKLGVLSGTWRWTRETPQVGNSSQNLLDWKTYVKEPLRNAQKAMRSVQLLCKIMARIFAEKAIHDEKFCPLNFSYSRHIIP